MTGSTVTAIQADDNIISRRKAVMGNIEGIKERKQKILAMLKQIGEAEQPDKVLIGKLVEAFDGLSTQEKQYMQILESIKDIHEQATKDVEREVEAVRQQEGEEKEKEEKAGEEDTEDDWAEMKQLMSELQEVSAQALAASLLNEQLVDRLNLHKSKKAAMYESRRERVKEVKARAHAALDDVEKTRLKVSSERKQADGKKKQLDQLRREAVQRGIELAESEQMEKDAVVEAAVAEEARTEQRIPPVEAAVEGAEEEEEEGESDEGDDKPGKAKHEKLKREQVTAQIREKLAAMEARQERMRHIREMLTGGLARVQAGAAPDMKELGGEAREGEEEGEGESSDQLDLETTLANARANLANLAAMRSRLEEMHAAGEELPEEDAQLIDRMDDSMASIASAPEVKGVDDVTEQEEKKEVEKTSSDSAVASQASSAGVDELESAIRGAWTQHMDTSGVQAVLGELAGLRSELAGQRRQLRLCLRGGAAAAAAAAGGGGRSMGGAVGGGGEGQCSRVLRALRRAPPSLLAHLATALAALAAGQHHPDLPLLVEELFEEEQHSDASSLSPLRRSLTPDAVQHTVVVVNRQPERECSASAEIAEREKEEGIDAIRAGRAEKGLERTVDSIVAPVRRRLREMEGEPIGDDTLQSIRELVVEGAARACPVISKDLFDGQLGCLIGDDAACFAGLVASPALSDQLIFEISDILYNELAFFQLMSNLNSIGGV